MRQMFSTSTAVCLSLLACGGNSNNKTVEVADAKQFKDAPGSGGSGSGSCYLASTFSPTFTGSNSEADHFVAAAPDPEEVDFFGNLDAAGDIELDLFVTGGGSDFPTLTGAKSNMSITGMSGNDVGVVILADPDAQMNPQVVYLGTAGTLNVTSVGGVGSNFTGTATGLSFTHIDTGSNGATADPDGCKSSIASMSFTGAEVAGQQFQGTTHIRGTWVLSGRTR
jgi:hypothetical protein